MVGVAVAVGVAVVVGVAVAVAVAVGVADAVAVGVADAVVVGVGLGLADADVVGVADAVVVVTRRAPRAADLGVSRDDYDRLLQAQGGHCALCSNTPKTRRLHVDHDHKTGAVRGLLCYRCNRALPQYVDADWLARAAEYVRVHASNGDARWQSRHIVVDERSTAMRELRATGMSMSAIGERYGISRQRVHQIIGGAS